MSSTKKKPRSAKRFEYECIGQVTLGNEMDEAKLTNISASGIQFEAPNPIRLKTLVQLLWKDPELGILNPTMHVVREVVRPDREVFKYIYGAQYHNLEVDLKEKLVLLLKRLNHKEAQEALDKVQNASPEHLLQATENGYQFLKQALLSPQVQLPALAKAIESLGEYERNAFQISNDIAAHIQKYSTCTFQCKTLTFMVPIIYKLPDLKSRFFKIITLILKDIHEIENVRVLNFFQNFRGSNHQKKGLLLRIEESKNRTFYAKQDLLQIVYETFESIDGKDPLYCEPLKVITSEYEDSLEVTQSSAFDLLSWNLIKKDKLPKVLVDELIVDNRPIPNKLSKTTLILMFVSLAFIFATLLTWLF